MINSTSPARLLSESFEDYKLRCSALQKRAKLLTKPEVNPMASARHFMSPKRKDTKHTRARSDKKKGAL